MAEERKKRLRGALKRLGAAVRGRAQEALRPMDADDKEAATALATALLVSARDGYSKEEKEAIDDLWDAWKEARANTP